MLRAILGPSCSPVLSQIRALGHEASGSRSSPLSADQTAALRQWAASFRSSALDKSKAGCDVRFDRSGGKGGQAVNKQNTKATLTVSLAQAHWIPDPLKPTLTTSPYYAPNSHSLVLTGSAQRTQSANLDECFTKLQAHLLNLALPLMPADTTAETKERVKGYEEKYKAKVKHDKMKRKEIKSGRSGRGSYD